ncbi:MAG: response regulator [Bacilli bacterium]|nr:response regulator [Bacilli bacterium]MBP3635305.1 response regulator [Bacilli bacterium]
MDNIVLTPNITENTILVVDDSNITRNLIEKVYKDQYKVLMASNGREAIDIVDTMPDGVIVAILLDLNMPDLDGFAVLDYFKEKNLFSKIPVSIITGDSSKATINKVFTYDIVDVLIKPFSAFDIEKIVSKMIQ